MKLRSDLQVLPLPGDRDCVIIDDIGGRFSRAKRSLWNQLPIWLHSGEIKESDDHSRNPVYQQAVAAGWTQTRQAKRGSGWSPLSIKIPIASIDPIARRLLPYSDFVFAPKAILCWMMAAVMGIVMLVIRWDQWSGSVPSLARYLASLTPWSVALMFVVTKAIHELGHAVACRRLGSRCGVAGVWFLCGMPCPYVDVTEVWRQPHPVRRAMVMAAGMIAEGVVCVLAIWVWVFADSAAVRLASMNVILVCGVSTVLFNANPLMRYDGYFILSDLLDSTNLRVEANKAFMQLMALPTVRWPREGVRSAFLTVYHIASVGYRVFICVAIAAMLLAVADQWHLWRIALAIIVVMAGIATTRTFQGWFRMFQGKGKWSVVPKARRRWVCLGVLCTVIALLFMPIPRYRHIEGRLEARNSVAVYLPGEGIIDAVYVRVGDQVIQDQSLADLSDRQLAAQLVSVNAQNKILTHRSRASRLASLSNFRQSFGSPQNAPENQWCVLEEAVASGIASSNELIDRQRRLRVSSPADGIVLQNSVQQIGSPAETAVGNPSSAIPAQLSPGDGELPNDQKPWCRIATSSDLQVSLPLEATDHDEIQIGCPIRLTIPGRSPTVFRTEVRAVSPLRAGSDETTNDNTHTYHALADIKGGLQLDLRELPQWDGAACHAVAHLPARAMWRDLVEMIRELVGI